MANQNSETRNPIFWCLVAVAIGAVLAVIGWDKNESTIPERTHGAVTMIVIGCTLLVGGLLGWQLFGNRKP